MKSIFRDLSEDIRPYIVIIGLTLLLGSKNLYAENSSAITNRGASIGQSPDTSVENDQINPNTLPTLPSTAAKQPIDKFSPNLFSPVTAALIFVLIIIFIVAWIIKKTYPGGNMLFGTLPILQVLGRTHLAPKQTLALIKLDSRLILLGITDHQINPILTIDQPEEVSRLTTLIEQNRPAGITGSFRSLFSRETTEISHQQDSLPDISLNSLNKFDETEVLQLKNELHSLINKVQKLKGIGSHDSSG
ncbi:MAG: flagellar biosynthetic protein FliO [Phycisphaerae bacterium]